MPYDTVTVQGFYRSQPEVNDAITKAAKAKGAYAFFIVRQVDANQGGNQRITAYIYKKDAEKRVLQSPDAIPADSEAGRAALAKGGEAAKNVEIPGVATTAAGLRHRRSFLRDPVFQRRALHCHAAGRHQSGRSEQSDRGANGAVR
jgi:hypothetical protein